MKYRTDTGDRNSPDLCVVVIGSRTRSSVGGND